MGSIYIDGDSAPNDVISASEELAKIYGWTVFVVASFKHEREAENVVRVDPHPQAVDFEIIRRLKDSEPCIVVTGDYGLAAMALVRNAACLDSKGYEFTNDNIDARLAERHVHARLRRGGVRHSGPRARVGQDVEHFRRALTAILEKL